eukprot:TRINITY_DN51270_c0_g1_i1.p2 TRINITY_DN51270_c0_g1~~TRINITY_DN51270_c0_g1_i1.p2  ORF type:complete len:135 (-),score=11.77 TRINITY_DN51270_c0_g1_i1:51-455(-)
MMFAILALRMNICMMMFFVSIINNNKYRMIVGMQILQAVQNRSLLHLAKTTVISDFLNSLNFVRITGKILRGGGGRGGGISSGSKVGSRGKSQISGYLEKIRGVDSFFLDNFHSIWQHSESLDFLKTQSGQIYP